jgi:hypothetical protein
MDDDTRSLARMRVNGDQPRYENTIFKFGCGAIVPTGLVNLMVSQSDEASERSGRRLVVLRKRSRSIRGATILKMQDQRLLRVATPTGHTNSNFQF